MKILLASYFGNPNIGLFGMATDEFCLLPRGAPKQLQTEISNTLGVPVVCCNIAGTELPGALCIGSGKHLLVPEIVFDSEIALLKKSGIHVEVFKTDMTALGNNIAQANGSAVVGMEYSDDEVNWLKKSLKAKVNKISILLMNTIGSIVSVTSKGGIVHPDISDKELAALEKIFKVKLVRATVNQGNPYVSSGVIANSNGVVVGGLSRGAELSDIQQGFGIIKG